jgi:hypothetical protein
MEILRALKGGTDALNAIHAEMSVDDVRALLDDTNEAIAVRKPVTICAIQFFI